MNVIETAMKDFYDNDQNTMIQAIQQNITVRTELIQVAFALFSTLSQVLLVELMSIVIQEEWANEEKQWETCRSRTKTCAEK